MSPRWAHRNRRYIFTFQRRQVQACRIQHQDVSVQPNLVAGMSRQHWPALGLGNIADIQPFPTGKACDLVGKILNIIDKDRLPPIVIERQAHRLPCRACSSQVRPIGHTAASIAAERLRSLINVMGSCPNNFLAGTDISLADTINSGLVLCAFHRRHRPQGTVSGRRDRGF